MPPIPPMPPPGMGGVSLGISVTTTSAVVSREATPAASWRADLTTLVGSMIPGEGGGGGRSERGREKEGERGGGRKRGREGGGGRKRGREGEAREREEEREGEGGREGGRGRKRGRKGGRVQ